MSNLFDRLKKEQEDALKQKEVASAEMPAWLARLEGLMADIRRWLEPGTTGGLITIQPKSFPLQEELLGSYQAEGLVLGFGSKRLVEVQPIAAMIMGAKGRVELKPSGCRSRMGVVLLFRGEQWIVWPDDKHARTKPETLPALDEKIFLHLLKEMV